jgi:ATP-dependent DNA ligase
MDVNGMSVVVTGRIEGETRQSAEAKLRAAGAHAQSSVARDTQLLVTGAAVGQTKLNAARKHGARIASWEEVTLGGEAGGEPSGPLVTNTAVHRQIAPMLCKHADALPGGEGWLYEVKWDGYRCLARVGEGGRAQHGFREVELQSRSGKRLDFPEIEEALAELDLDCLLDGEIVVLDSEGRSSFHALSNARGSGATFIAFDVLETMGTDIRGFPLEARREALAEIVGDDPQSRVRISPAFEDGETLLALARERGLEGIVAKRLGSRYEEGTRGPSWLKLKVRREQEFVVVGWTPGKNGNTGHLGALVLAVNGEPGLVYTAGSARASPTPRATSCSPPYARSSGRPRRWPRCRRRSSARRSGSSRRSSSRSSSSAGRRMADSGTPPTRACARTRQRPTYGGKGSRTRPEGPSGPLRQGP